MLYRQRKTAFPHSYITRLGGILSVTLTSTAPSVYGIFFSSTGTILTTPTKEVKCHYFTATRTPGPIVELRVTFFM
ncbi:hypothetical protein DES34_12361 [Brevibacillus brevis]|nr:hypothetical protein DES34_12361 [Brevibacillus brevis]TQK41875.1 hypothetical protein FB479_11757 [Brevibacillus sp. AG162]